MGLEGSDLPMVRCIVDKSRGEEGRADLLSGMMQDAIHSSNQDAVWLLLEAGIDADGESPFGESLLLSALYQLTFTDSDSGQSPEGEAVVAIADILVDEGARVPEPSGEYVNAWFIAVETSPDAMRIMIRAGMDANVRRPLEKRFNVETALVHAVKRACSSVVSDPDRPELEIVRVLVEAVADVNTMSIGQILDENDLSKVIGLFESETVLSDAVRGQTGCPQVVSILREAGACLDLEGRRVEWGSELDFDGILQFLSAPAVFSLREGVGRAAPPPDSLERAIGQEDVDMVRLLIEAGADVNAVVRPGTTLLQWAVSTVRNPTIIELLKKAGAK